MTVPVLLSFALLWPFGVGDPSPSMTWSKDKSRMLECERLLVETAVEIRPGLIGAERPRGDYIERSVLLCSEPLMRRGLRAPRDEAILSELDARADELAVAARSSRPDLEGHTWLVETHYPSAQVAAKIGFATKNALMSQGLSVSDRLPTLGAGDVDVITRMPPEQAYPAACKRYFDMGSLGDNDALLAVVSRDPRETILHAGLCTRGRWMWLR